MQTFGHIDFILYFIVSYFVILYDHGVRALLMFYLDNLYFTFIKLPYLYLAKRLFCPFPYQSSFSQRATDCEYVMTEMLKYYFSFLQSKDVGIIFFDGRIFEIINIFRNLRELGDGLGDIIYHNFQGSDDTFDDVKGAWIYSKSRVLERKHDVLVLYIHGGVGYGMGNGHMYTEYLSILTVNLLEQGFSNPGIFVPEFPKKVEKYPNHLCLILRSYEYLTTISNPNCHLVIAGDSTGATLTLSLLLTLSKPSELVLKSILGSRKHMLPFKSISELATHYTYLRKPSTAILISPITNIFNPSIKPIGDDYLTVPVLKLWGTSYVGSELRDNAEERIIFDPGQCKDIELWKKALPRYGLVISYGSEELMVNEIEGFITLIKQTGVKVRVDKQNAQIHNWAILNFYSERLIDHREASLQIYSGILSRILLWQTDSFFQPAAKGPVNIITIDEDYT